MTKKADSLSKTETEQGAEPPGHWLQAVDAYGWYLCSVVLCCLGSGVQFMVSLESDDLSLFGAFSFFVALLLWLAGVVILAVREWERFRADKTGYFYTPRFDVILVAVFSAYVLFRSLFLTETDAPMKYAQGDTFFLRELLFALILFLAACVGGAYCQTHKRPEPVASEEEYQAYKRLAEAQKPHVDEDKGK